MLCVKKIPLSINSFENRKVLTKNKGLCNKYVVCYVKSAKELALSPINQLSTPSELCPACRQRHIELSFNSITS